MNVYRALKNNMVNKEKIDLGNNFSTTRTAIKMDPGSLLSELESTQKTEFKLETILFCPVKKGRQGDGGLRKKGYFKKPIPSNLGSVADSSVTLPPDLKPLISIVTIVFNGKEFLEETILSVINQTYDNIEYIVIDGGSRDGTLEIIKKYEHAIDYWVSENDGGIYDAMNKGINLATGNWINFMNSGDCFSDYKILNEVNLQNLQVDLIYGDYSIRRNNRNIYKDNKNHSDLWKGFFCHQAMFVSTKLMKKFKFNLDVGFNADTDLILRLLQKKIFYQKVNKSLCIIEPGGISDVNRIQSVLNQWKLTRSYKINSLHRIDVYFSYLIIKNLLVILHRKTLFIYNLFRKKIY